jgi:hypothetical protein
MFSKSIYIIAKKRLINYFTETILNVLENRFGCNVLAKHLDKSALAPALASIAKRHLELVANLIEFTPIETTEINGAIMRGDLDSGHRTTRVLFAKLLDEDVLVGLGVAQAASLREIRQLPYRHLCVIVLWGHDNSGRFVAGKRTNTVPLTVHHETARKLSILDCSKKRSGNSGHVVETLDLFSSIKGEKAIQFFGNLLLCDQVLDFAIS